MIAILSYPRSGNTWLRLIVEWATGGYTEYVHPSAKDEPIFRRGDLKQWLTHVDPKKKTGIKFHFLKDIETIDISDLIVIVRNPYECIFRHKGYKDFPQQALYFTQIIKYYNEFDGSRLMVYYEDLLTSPSSEIEKIFDFLGVNISKINSFMDIYDSIFESSVAGYEVAQGSSHTKGKKMLHHSVGVKSGILADLTAILKEYPAEIQQYITRYTLGGDKT